MFWSKENTYKKYSVIIIPERGSNTKTLNLSANLLKIVMAVFFIVLIFITFLIVQFLFLRKDISVIDQKDKYIKVLENDKKADMKKLDNYNKNQAMILNKLKELQLLEDVIKSKLKKSISFKKDMSNNYVNTSAGIDNESLIKKIDEKITGLGELGKGLDSMLAEEDKIPSSLPCLGNISSYFGFRKNPFDRIRSDFHPGIDIACSKGTKIYAAASGTIVCASYNAGYGNEVAIDHHNGIETIYGHNSRICVHTGEIVKKGQLIAYSGSTGSSTGPHLHFEIRKNDKPVDPKAFFIKGEE